VRKLEEDQLIFNFMHIIIDKLDDLLVFYVCVCGIFQFALARRKKWAAAPPSTE
jgi:hypothetical protein